MNRPWSIRGRLALLAGGGAAFLAIASGMTTAWILEARLRNDFDRDLLEKARVLSTLTEQEGNELEFESIGDSMPEFQRADRPEYFEIWSGETRLARSPSLGTSFFGRAAVPGSLSYRNLRLPDGRPGRAIQIQVSPRFIVRDRKGEEHSVASGEIPAGVVRRPVTLVVGAGLADLHAAIARVRAVLFGVGLVFVLGLVLLLRWVIDSTLLPLQRVADRVALLEPRALGGRVSSADLPLEILPLTGRLDDLLARLETTFERERLFSSNLAHELRTPVAELRSLAEVAARWPADRDAIRAFFSDVETVAGQMEGLITNLLALARSEAGAESIQPEEAIVEDLTRAVWSRLRSRAAERQVSLDLQAPPAAVVVTDVAKLRLILANLLGNAVDYAPAGSAVACRVTVDDPSFLLSVSNLAPQLEGEDLGRLFDRFWRKDEARGGGQHAGLGLTLVRSLCGTLGYRVEPLLTPEGVLAIQVSGPRVVSA